MGKRLREKAGKCNSYGKVSIHSRVVFGMVRSRRSRVHSFNHLYFAVLERIIPAPLFKFRIEGSIEGGTSRSMAEG